MKLSGLFLTALLSTRPEMVLSRTHRTADVNFESFVIHVRRSVEMTIEGVLKTKVITIEVLLDSSAERLDSPCLQLAGEVA